jgi:hypothetical protein
MAKEHEVRKALGGGKKEGAKLHTHSVHYERAHNGGVIAHVRRHTGTPGGADHAHHHTEEHVLPDVESAQEHMQEHMGDQPAAGEMEPQQTAAPPEPEMAGGGGQAGM